MTLQAALRRFADAGFAACAIEASSIGIVEHRLDGTRIDVALFTNFTQDHLDYHGTMDAYWAAKAQLFAWPGLRAAVVNVDDAQGAHAGPHAAGGGARPVDLLGRAATRGCAPRTIGYARRRPRLRRCAKAARACAVTHAA